MCSHNAAMHFADTTDVDRNSQETSHGYNKNFLAPNATQITKRVRSTDCTLITYERLTT